MGLLEPSFRKWRIRINTKKCTVTLLSKRLLHYRCSTQLIKIFSKNIAWTKETKYLGATLDSKLTYRTNISYILRKANCGLRQLLPVLNKSSINDINLTLVIYKALLSFHVDICLPLMGLCCQHLHE
jgi:hypothetical protein